MITAETYGDSIKSSLKQRGFHKKNLSWNKQTDDVTILFNIQKSIYGSDVWYYNFGICINSIHEKKVMSLSGCDMVYRIEQRIRGKWVTQDTLLKLLDIWIEKYGTVDKLHIHAISNTLPAPISKQALSYLTTVVF